jgi:DNA-binding transcriptional ArsR family regulator
VRTYVRHGLSALGDPTRLAIFERLGAQPHAVNELAAGLPVSRPAVSQHLRVLKRARLVRDRRAGTRRIYELNPEGIALLRDHFAQLWDQALAAFQKVAEDEFKKENEHDSRTASSNSHRVKENPARRRAH